MTFGPTWSGLSWRATRRYVPSRPRSGTALAPSCASWPAGSPSHASPTSTSSARREARRARTSAATCTAWRAWNTTCAWATACWRCPEPAAVTRWSRRQLRSSLASARPRPGCPCRHEVRYGGLSEEQVALTQHEVDVRAEDVAGVLQAGECVRHVILALGCVGGLTTKGDLALGLIQAGLGVGVQRRRVARPDEVHQGVVDLRRREQHQLELNCL